MDKLTKTWSGVSPLIFKSCFALGNGRFLLAGGMHSLSNSPSSHSCAMAVFDALETKWEWCTELKKNRLFDFACVCDDFAVGGIASNFKHAPSGLLRFRLSDGLPLDDVLPLEALCGLASFSDGSFVAATVVSDSHLHFCVRDKHTTVTISSDRFFKTRGLLGVLGKRFMTTMQVTELGTVSFVHQMRGPDCQILWEYTSKNDTAIQCGEDRIAVYRNAGANRHCVIEFLDAGRGKKLSEVQVKGSIANLTHIVDDSFVYCSPKYEAIIATNDCQQKLASFPLPGEVPGWISFAVDQGRKLVLACKGNNFRSPQSTIEVFSF